MIVKYFSLQVDRMYEYMATYQGKPEDLVNFTVQTHRGRGIYIREEAELMKKQQQFMVNITPQFVSNKGGLYVRLISPQYF